MFSVRQLSKLDGMLDEIIDAVRRKFNLEVWGWERNMGLGMRFLDCFFIGLEKPKNESISRVLLSFFWAESE